jgi:hypothetical protein
MLDIADCHIRRILYGQGVLCFLPGETVSILAKEGANPPV